MGDFEGVGAVGLWGELAGINPDLEEADLAVHYDPSWIRGGASTGVCHRLGAAAIWRMEEGAELQGSCRRQRREVCEHKISGL
jgi:hypothetical protein